ncbi:MAG: tRNA (adenosine(37)-N6)-threonylcarbamoyltransferase complex ATPase subunit type 1 TsaE [Magnetococcales bacterium]|nr:tRNA (adenosine(37)-N6)-threonylcarbamoyltransferase complex ATPase subunit type 1 TsaE [Magnetococcales bacterium]NGZ06648.1 tRNA (adenosine(37)-N6)-threonylcarbamoyltransferase complex ATPase subunit type 1 TsaE [Magnetococcales bacterium]
MVWSTETTSEQQTEALGRALARFLQPGVAVLLSGDLGCGKSVFARGVLRGLGVEAGSITSPTFTLVNPYPEGRLPAAHFDLYRIADPEELDLVGIEEYVDGAGVVLVEWPEQGVGQRFGSMLTVRLEDRVADPQWRRITLRAEEPLSRDCLHDFVQQRGSGG